MTDEPVLPPPDDDGPDDGPEDAAEAGGEPGAPTKRRRRRRRRGGGAPGEAAAPPTEGAPADAAAPAPDGNRPAKAYVPRAPGGQPPQQQPPQQNRPPQNQQPRERGERGRRERGGGGERQPQRPQNAQPAPRSQPGAPRAQTAAPITTTTASTSAPTMARLAQQPRAHTQSGRAQNDEELDAPSDVPAVAWGTDDGAPAPAVVLAPDLPTEADGDPDPVTAALGDGPAALGTGELVAACGVRFAPSGRITWFDAGDAHYAAGDRVVVDSDRGPRLGWIATPPARRASRDRGMRRVMRVANDTDLRGERDGDDERARGLRAAKDAAAALRLPLKVFRVELAGGLGRGGKLMVYYTSDERIDVRDLVRELGRTVAARVELRQLGTRDEAKAVGGIGSCGLTLCCTTWMPEFVPVSIKMAKDQGLSLAPSKVMGQCGRLKCCLVYEQAGYAELRKGLPKLGKRVISPRGEGRVVEVDVLRQRIRVSYGMGDSEVLPATEVKSLFPPGSSGRPSTSADEPDLEPEPEPEPEPDLPPTDDPSADPNLA